MSRQERMALIKEIEKKRNSKVIVYMTGDRRGLETKISTDIFPKFHEHLNNIKKGQFVDLFLYSASGDNIAGYSLVNLIREFCGKFSVIIPFKALGSATLISLGADEILMTNMGQFSPINQTIEHPLAPTVQIPGQPPSLVAINPQDIDYFIKMAQEKLNFQELSKILELLSSKIHPLVLGASYRSHEQIVFLATKLMERHTNDTNVISECVRMLTEQKFPDAYIINRKEAKEILKLNILDLDEKLTELIIKLFSEYNSIVKIDQPYHPEVILENSDSKIVNLDRAIIESEGLTHIFRTKREIKRTEIPLKGIPTPSIGYQQRNLQESWVEENFQ